MEKWLKVDNRKISFSGEKTILELAQENKIDIPTLCYHPDFCAKGNCRVCVVEVAGSRKLLPACVLQATEGMEVFTKSERVLKARRVNLKLIYGEHLEKCATCIWRFDCKLLKYAQDYKVVITSFSDRKTARKVYHMNEAMELDGSQCIDCRNCIDACQMMTIDCLMLKNKGTNQEIVPSDKKKCIACGQCALHCPVSAIQEQTEYEGLEMLFKNKKKKKIVALVDPVTLLSAGENIGVLKKPVDPDYLNAGLLKIGFDAVEMESDLILKKVQGISNHQMKGGLIGTCPAFVNYIKMYKPALTSRLIELDDVYRLGIMAIRNKIAFLQGVESIDVSISLITPCVAKKNNSLWRECSVEAEDKVDKVLTVRETSYLLRKNKIFLSQSKNNNKIGDGSLTEKLIEALQLKLFGKKAEINKQVLEENANIQIFELQNKDQKITFLKVIGLSNFHLIEKDISNYDFIEVMACPSACLGGGGQEVPTNKNVIQNRMKKSK